MNKDCLADSLANQFDMDKRTARKMVNYTLGEIKDAVARGEKVTLVGFGTFQSKDRAQRTGTNPNSGELITIPAKRVPTFKPGADFKEAVDR